MYRKVFITHDNQKTFDQNYTKLHNIIIVHLVRFSFIYSYYRTLHCQLIHILCNLLVVELSVDLRAGNGRMPHHLGNALHRDASLQSQRDSR